MCFAFLQVNFFIFIYMREMFPLQPTDRLCSYCYYCLPGYRVQKRKREGGGTLLASSSSSVPWSNNYRPPPSLQPNPLFPLPPPSRRCLHPRIKRTDAQDEYYIPPPTIFNMSLWVQGSKSFLKIWNYIRKAKKPGKLCSMH